MNEENKEEMTTATTPVIDENFKRVVKEVAPTFDKIQNLGYRGSLVGLDAGEIQTLLYQLGNLIGLLEAELARKTGDFDSAGRQD